VGNSPSKHRPQFTHYWKWKNLGEFEWFLVYRMYLNEKSWKTARKICWSWSGESSKWHVLLSPKLVILEHFHFHLEKHIEKTWNFAQLKLLKDFKISKFWVSQKTLDPKFQLPSHNLSISSFSSFEFLKQFWAFSDFLQEISKLSIKISKFPNFKLTQNETFCKISVL
jgi:hypothetical protein